jgi:hypothetical protein
VFCWWFNGGVFHDRRWNKEGTCLWSEVGGTISAVNRAHRVVLVLYCSLLVYCCVWIPWCISNRYVVCERVGYGWVWAGPSRNATIFDRITKAAIPLPPAGFTLESLEPTWERARPDLELIILRLIAATGIGAALFVLAGMKPRS